MSLATFKKKTQAKYHNNSVNEVQFSTVGAYRNQGRVGQSNQSRSLTGPNSNGTTLCSKNDNTVVKKASMNTNGMLMSRYRWLRRPYDAAQPLNSISVKPGAGNILYGSQDAYIERKRKEAMCCDNGYASTSTSALTTIVSRIIDTPLLEVFKSALGQESIPTTDNFENFLDGIYNRGRGAGYDKIGIGSSQNMTYIYLSDSTRALIRDMLAKFRGSETISDINKVRSNNSTTLSEATEMDTSTHSVSLQDINLMARATSFNNTKGIVLSNGTNFLGIIIEIKKRAQAAQILAMEVVARTARYDSTATSVATAAVVTGVVSGTSVNQSVGAVWTLNDAVLDFMKNNNGYTYVLPNLYGDINNDADAIEQEGALATISAANKDANNIPTDLTDEQLRLLTVVIYTIAANGDVRFNTDNSAAKIVADYTQPTSQLVSDSQLGGEYFPRADNYDRDTWSDRQKAAMTKFYELQAKMQLIGSYQRFMNFPATVNFNGGASGYISDINSLRNGLSNNADNLTTLITLFFSIYQARALPVNQGGLALSTPMSYAELNLLSQYLFPYTSGFTNLKYTIGSSSTTITVDASNLVSTFIQILTVYHNIINDNAIGGDALIFAYTSDIQGFGVSKGSVITTINELIVRSYSVTISDLVYETIVLKETRLQTSLTTFSGNWKQFYTATQSIVDYVNSLSEKPESIISLGDIVSIGDQYFIITGISQGVTVKNLRTKTDALQTIPLGTNVNLITLSDGDGNRTIQTGVTTTTAKGCCLLDIDKAFLDQNNQQKHCGSTNTCG